MQDVKLYEDLKSLITITSYSDFKREKGGMIYPRYIQGLKFFRDRVKI